MRTYNIAKKEWILNGKSVTYGGATELKATLDYDFQMERDFSYAGLSMTEIIAHLARFIARLWQIHVFSEGNTRTTAVFLIKYLKHLGFQVTNDIFAKNAWYFRNALVWANHTDLSREIQEDAYYLELFLRNLLLGERNELKNRRLHVDWSLADETASSDQKQPFKQPFNQPFERDQPVKDTGKRIHIHQNSAEYPVRVSKIWEKQDFRKAGPDETPPDYGMACNDIDQKNEGSSGN